MVALLPALVSGLKVGVLYADGEESGERATQDERAAGVVFRSGRSGEHRAQGGRAVLDGIAARQESPSLAVIYWERETHSLASAYASCRGRSGPSRSPTASFRASLSGSDRYMAKWSYRWRSTTSRHISRVRSSMSEEKARMMRAISSSVPCSCIAVRARNRHVSTSISARLLARQG